MKLFLLFSFLVLTNITTAAQQGLLDAVKAYYKQNPFQSKFSSFLANILSDTSLVRDEFYKRTDSGFFYFRGHYKNFNPFHFKTFRVQVVVAEGQFVHSDSFHTLDTLIVYQITGITDSSEKNQLPAKKEFDRFHRRYKNSFLMNQYDVINNNGAVEGEVYSYFLSGDISPMTINWENISKLNRFAFSITLRIKVLQNMADLP